MKNYSFDAIVIGSGCAGYNCADYLHEFGVTNIAVITEGKNVGTSRNTGSDKQTYYKLSLSGDEGDSVGKMAQTLHNGGAMDGDTAIIEAANSVRSFMKLVNIGVNFPTNSFGEYVGYKTDHDPYQRATSIGPYTSKSMTEALERSVESKNITLFDKLQVVKILKEDDRVIGVMALDLGNGELVAIEAKNVVVATGGPAGIYYDSVYPKGHTGSSSLIIDAGAEMRNLSEWQYGLASVDFRWNVSGTYQQVLPRFISVDENGVEREFLPEYFETAGEMLDNVFLKGYEWPFDVRKIRGSSYIDLLVYHQTAVLGRKVYMDFTRDPFGLEKGFDALGETAYEYLKNSDALIPLPIERLKKMNPDAIELYKSHGIDITSQLLRVAVCAQHNNGGASVDKDWQTTVRGLYVIGEAAGTLGIFRPGGSALNSCQVGGLRAAEHIAFESKNQFSSKFEAIADCAAVELTALINACRGAHSTLGEVKTRYQKRMSKSFAFLRNPAEMKVELDAITLDKSAFISQNKWCNPQEISELFKNYDAITVSECVATSMFYAAEKYGSRGSAMVTDKPFLQREIINENEAGREKAVACVKKERITAYEKELRPLPDREQWFEKAWAQYREKRGI